MTYYESHGLTIDSTISLPLPTVDTDSSDVSIHTRSLEDRQVTSSNRVVYDDSEALLWNETAGGFFVSGGNEIVVDPETNATKSTVQRFILGSVFAMLLHQRGHTLLHGGVTVHDGESVVFLGSSGAGKSTIATAMANRGGTVIADDYVPVLSGPEPGILTGPPLVRVEPATIDMIDQKHARTAVPANGDEKPFVQIGEQAPAELYPLAQVIILTSGGDTEVLSTEGALFELLQASYGTHFDDNSETKQRYLDAFATVAENVPVTSVPGANSDWDLDQTVDAIEETLSARE